jgi:hypothetical protein
MILSIDKEAGALQIELSGTERLLMVRFARTVTVPLSSIEGVSTDTPESSWLELRAPGTMVPGLIKAGTYYTRRGKELWYAVRKKGFLVLDLKDHPYRRIVLTLDDNEAWADELQAQG